MAGSPLIAIVDDDESVRDALTSLLHSVGWQAEAFASAEAFLLSGQVHTTACLLLDIRLPGLNGLELQRQLRSSQACLPLIFLTAHGTEAMRAQALQAGAHHQTVQRHRLAGGHPHCACTGQRQYIGLYCMPGGWTVHQ
jgi:FixJ family two-component response regulator